MKPLLALTGPTASGKSQLALQLAQELDGELLCFDSTTVYQGLDIGTAKPSREDQKRVPHHLLDLVPAGQEFSLAHFLKEAEEALRQVRSRGRWPILVGGTFLYLQAFLEGYRLSPVPPDPEFRHWCEQQSLESLVVQLLAQDPEAGPLLDLANPRRVIRALEVNRAGQTYSSSQQRCPRAEPVVKISLKAQPDWLKDRIERRCREMLAQGFLQEVRGLQSLAPWLASMGFIGYREALQALEQGWSQEQLSQAIALATWRLVKKQRTWSRSSPADLVLAAENAAKQKEVFAWLEKVRESPKEIKLTGEP